MHWLDKPRTLLLVTWILLLGAFGYGELAQATITIFNLNIDGSSNTMSMSPPARP